MEKKNEQDLIQAAIQGDSAALEELLLSVRDQIFTLALRMLGSVADAEDAVSEILIKVMCNLSAFRQESAFSTWVYRIAVNTLLTTRKSMFANQPLSFEIMGQDIEAGYIEAAQKDTCGVEHEILADELKLSCTNVMLQCLKPEDRCIFILGTMFKLDSQNAADILNISAENYRQRLSRSRKKVGGFLKQYCGLVNKDSCSCQKRLGVAIKTHRLNPQHLEYSDHVKTENFIQNMEDLDEISDVYREEIRFCSHIEIKEFLKKLLQSRQLNEVMNEGRETA